MHLFTFIRRAEFSQKKTSFLKLLFDHKIYIFAFFFPSIFIVLDIGCSTGGLLSVMEGNGFAPGNLFGVDLSPKAIELNKREHPNYNCQVVKDFRLAQW